MAARPLNSSRSGVRGPNASSFLMPCGWLLGAGGGAARLGQGGPGRRRSAAGAGEAGQGVGEPTASSVSQVQAGQEMAS